MATRGLNKHSGFRITCRKPALQSAYIITGTATTQPIFYIDEFELVRVFSIDPEYQYDLKDHLGNVRVTFGTKTKDVFRATYESDSMAKDKANFHRYDLSKAGQITSV